MLKHAKGDLVEMAYDGYFDVIIHGCNCFNTMGSGIARTIREKCHDAWLADQHTLQSSKDKLGSYSTGFAANHFGQPTIVINAYTQYATSKNGKDVFEYAAFDIVLRKIAERFGSLAIGLPYIGMGLANGDKNKIMSSIEDFACKVTEHGGTVTLVEYSK